MRKALGGIARVSGEPPGNDFPQHGVNEIRCPKFLWECRLVEAVTKKRNPKIQ
jgi:hypothetical protein